MKMRRFKFNKLVRDGVIEQMLIRKDKPVYRQLTGDEALKFIEAKLLEEAGEIDMEYLSASTLEELADLTEVLDLAVAQAGFDWADVNEARRKKREKAGGFSNLYHVDYVDVNKNSDWIEHFTANPDRYPEISPDKQMDKSL